MRLTRGGYIPGRELLRLTRVHNVSFIKVKGHADNEYNNLCDKLATTAVKNFKA